MKPTDHARNDAAMNVTRNRTGRAPAPSDDAMRNPGDEPMDEFDPGKPIRGDHCLTIYITHDVKSRLKRLGDRYDRPMSDIVRGVLRVGIPMMEALTQAEEVMVHEYIKLFRKLRKVKSLKEV